MKNLFTMALIATLAVASSVAARGTEPRAPFNAVVKTEKEVSIPASAEEEQGLWQRKHLRKQKHDEHEEQKHEKYCIKYVTVTETPECQPTP